MRLLGFCYEGVTLEKIVTVPDKVESFDYVKRRRGFKEVNCKTLRHIMKKQSRLEAYRLEIRLSDYTCTKTSATRQMDFRA